MPFVQIALRKGQPPEYLKALSQSIQQAMTDIINIPPDDYFHVINEYQAEHFLLDKTYPNTERSQNAVVIHITMSLGRTLEVKKALYQKIAENLHDDLGMRKEDVMIILTENDFYNWSFAHGSPR